MIVEVLRVAGDDNEIFNKEVLWAVMKNEWSKLRLSHAAVLFLHCFFSHFGRLLFCYQGQPQFYLFTVNIWGFFCTDHRSLHSVWCHLITMQPLTFSLIQAAAAMLSCASPQVGSSRRYGAGALQVALCHHGSPASPASFALLLASPALEPTSHGKLEQQEPNIWRQ